MLRKTKLIFPIECLEEAVYRFNVHVMIANQIMPKITDALNGTKITANKVGHPTRRKIDAIIQEANELFKDWLGILLDTQYVNSVYLRFNINFPRANGSFAYISKSYCVADRDADSKWIRTPAWRTKELIETTYTEVVSAMNLISEKEEQSQNLFDEINEAKQKVYSFFN